MSAENDLQPHPLKGPGGARLRWEVTTVGCLYVGYAGLILCRTAVPIAAPAMIDDPTLVLNAESFGALLGWGAGGALAGKLLCGVAADRFGGRRLFLFAMGSMAVTTLAFGMSSAPALFMFFNFAAQLTKAAGWPAMAKTIGAWFEAGRLGRIWGIISTSSRASSVLSSLLLGALLTVLPWRWLFVVAGAITLCVLVVCFFALKDSPTAVGLKAPPKPDAKAGDSSSSTWSESLSSTLAFFAGSNRVQLICVSIVTLTLQMEFLSFLPLYMVEVHGLEPGAAGIASSAFPAGSFLSLLAGGVVYDRLVGRQRVRVIAALLAIGALSVGLLFGLPELSLSPAAGLGLAIFATFVFGFAVSPAYYIPMSVFAIQFGRSRSGVLIGLIDAFGYAATMIFAPLAGALLEVRGWPTFLGVLVGISVMSLVFLTAFLTVEDRTSTSV
jgi:sugar phosphate permease